MIQSFPYCGPSVTLFTCTVLFAPTVYTCCMTLKFSDCGLRDQDCVVADFGRRLSLGQTARAARTLPGLGNEAAIADRAGLRVQLAIDECDATLVGIFFTIANVRRERNLRSALKQIAAARTRPLHESEIFAVADGEIDLDGIQLRNRRKHGLRADKVSNLRGGLSRDAGDQRADLRKAEIQFGRVYRCLRGLYGRFGLGFLLNLVIQLALRNGMRSGQRSVAIHIDFGEAKLGLGLPSCPCA